MSKPFEIDNKLPTIMQAGGLIVLFTGFLGHVMPLFNYFGEYLLYAADLLDNSAQHIATKPAWPLLPPPLVGLPWIVSGGIIFFTGIWLNKFLRENKGALSMATKFVLYALIMLSLFSFHIVFYSFKFVPQKFDYLIHRETK